MKPRRPDTARAHRELAEGARALLAEAWNEPLTLEDIAVALRKTRGKVVFIDNLVHEKGPAGTLSVTEKLAFLEQHIGQCVVDLVLSNHHDPQLQIPRLGGLTADSDVHYRHDPDVLLQRLNAAVETLFKQTA